MYREWLWYYSQLDQFTINNEVSKIYIDHQWKQVAVTILNYSL